MISTLSALAEPNRLHIVEFLRDGPRPVGEIVAHLGMHQPQVSKHLRVLVEAGLVEVQPAGQRRVYRLRQKPFQELETWLDSYHRTWEERFDRLDHYLAELQATEKNQRTQP